jgi:uracil-DNA glycosylase
MAKTVPSILKPGATFAILGEAPSVDDEDKGVPFVGAAGGLLNHILKSVGIDRNDCSLLNVFCTRPPKNDVSYFFQGKLAARGLNTPYPPYNGKYLKPAWWQEIERVRRELTDCNPRIVFALGGAALWSLTHLSRINDHRGTLLNPHQRPGGSNLSGGVSENPTGTRTPDMGLLPWDDDDGNIRESSSTYQIIPTFSPRAILADYALLPVVTADFDRGFRAASGTLSSVAKRIIIPESKADLEQVFDKLEQFPLLAVDVETEDKQITCISIAPASDLSYSIPIWSKLEPGWCAWSLDTEVLLWYRLKLLLEGPRRLIFHNGMYDLTYLATCGIVPRLTPHDTMMIQHSAQPEMRKSLGFMASLYTDNPSWKWRNPKRIKDIDKTDE